MLNSLLRSRFAALLASASLLVVCLATTGIDGGAGGQAQSKAEAKAAAVLRANNLGVAYMDQQRPEDALKEFRQAVAADSRNYIPQLNSGIALLNMQRADEARAILVEVTQSHPEDAHGWYNLGLLEKSAGNSEAAGAAFSRALAIDPSDADIHYFIATINSELHEYPKAIEEFGATLKINPFHVSAEFGLAQAYQRSGDSANAKTHLERFQHLTAAKLGAPMSLVYGEQGKYSLAEQISAALSPVLPAIPVHFEDVTAEFGFAADASRFGAQRSGWRPEHYSRGRGRLRDRF